MSSLLLLLLSALADSSFIGTTSGRPGAPLSDRSWPDRRWWAGAGRRGAVTGQHSQQAGRIDPAEQPLWTPPTRVDEEARQPPTALEEAETVQPRGASDIPEDGAWQHWLLLSDPVEKGVLHAALSRQKRKHGRPHRWRAMERLCRRRGECTCYSAKARATFCCDCEWGSCFPGAAQVTLVGGRQLSMSQLTAGDRVMTASDGRLTATTVLGFLDRRPHAVGEYLHLRLAGGARLRLSANHLTFTRAGGATFAADVRRGDQLIVAASNSTAYSHVVGVDYTIMQGAYVPLTEHGTLLVDGVLASNYATFAHELCHALTAPFRLWPSLLSPWLEVGHKNVLVDGLKRVGRLAVATHPGGVVRLSAV